MVIFRNNLHCCHYIRKGPPLVRIRHHGYPRCRIGVQGGPLYTLPNFMFVITLPVGFLLLQRIEISAFFEEVEIKGK